MQRANGVLARRAPDAHYLPFSIIGPENRQ
jgi:hypothetical protein